MMTTTYFSATTLWFYDLAEKAKYEAGIGWPADAVEITADEIATFTGSPPEGYQLSHASDGKPAWGKIPSPTVAELTAAAATLKAARIQEAADILAPLQDAVDLEMATDDEKARFNEWRKYRVLLNRVDTSKAPDITWPPVPAA